MIGYWPASNLLKPTTSPAGTLAQEESTSNKVNDQYLPFANGSTTYAGFSFIAPKSLNEGTLVALIEWKEAGSATLHVCRWQFECQAQGDEDTIDAIWGTAITVDATGAAGKRHIETLAAATPAGTWVAGDKIHCRVARLGGHANDTLDVDARLLSVTLFGTVNAQDDS